MASETRQNTVVGIFALVGLGVMAVMVFMFGGGQSLFASTYDVNVHFKKGVRGVQRGQGVTLYGKRIGETKRVDFWTDKTTGEQRPEMGVIVVVAVDADYDLPRASVVKVDTSIMGLGRPVIKIEITDPGDPTRLPRNGSGEIDGEMVDILDLVLPMEMQEALTGATESIRDLATALTPVADNLAHLFEARDVEKVDLGELTANVDTLIQRSDVALRNVNVFLGDERNQENLRESLANIRKMSDSGPAVMADLKAFTGEGKQFMKEATAVARSLAATADKTSAVLTRLDQALALLTQGEGTAALFLRDNRLYEELLLSAKRLTKALDDVREAFRGGKLHM